MEQLWYKNAVFYSLDVETFYDANGDGIGDFQGLIRKLDYLAGLGINCIWLLPFFPSPNRDNGYDVTDYYNVDPRLGTLGDFAAFLDKAGRLGIKVIIDLVVNHTSVEHTWFQQARLDKNSSYRNYYVWSDEPLKFEKEHLMLKGEESSVWTFDEKAGQYYLHHFYKEQPDLNIANTAVQEEICKIVGFWLRLGVDGFRIDAAELLIEPYGLPGVNEKELVQFFNDLRNFVISKKPNVVLLAEVNAGPKEMKTFLDSGDRVQMLFNFYVNQHLFLALATQNTMHLAKALQRLPVIHQNNQWLNFLRHHDELSLKLLTAAQRKTVLDCFAPEQNMRIYEHGIRRRLAPMMEGNEPLQRLAYSLLFSLPGAPLLRYGSEIGMGDDLSLEGRNSVRTPMQWSKNKNGAFSTAAKKDLVQPVIDKGAFGYKIVNAMAAQQQPSSLLNWLERLITVRKQAPEIGFGKLSFLSAGNKSLLIHCYEWEDEKLLMVHNFSPESCTLDKKRLGLQNIQPEELFSDQEKNEDAAKTIAVNGYGYRWFRIEKL